MRFLYPVVRLVVRVDYQRVFQTIVDYHRVLDRMNIGWQLVAFPVLNFDLVRQNPFKRNHTFRDWIPCWLEYSFQWTCSPIFPTSGFGNWRWKTADRLWKLHKLKCSQLDCSGFLGFSRKILSNVVVQSSGRLVIFLLFPVAFAPLLVYFSIFHSVFHYLAVYYSVFTLFPLYLKLYSYLK